MNPQPPELTSKRNRPPNGHYAWDILWIGFLMLYIFAGRTVVPFHGDESAQIAMSVDYSYLFIERDMSKILYSDEPYNAIEQGLRLENAGLNRYLIGLSWHIAGFSPDDLNVPWWWGQDFDFLMQNNFYPGDDLLLVGRIPSALLTAGGVLLVFLIGMQLQGTITAYIASAFYGLHPAVLVSGRRAIKEGGHIFFGLSTLLVGIWFINTLNTPKDERRIPLWLNAILLGIVGGLGIASKHTNVMLVGTVYLSLTLYAIFQARQKLVPIALHLLLAGIVTGSTYIALHPAWWSNPVARAQQVASGRMNILSDQIDTFQVSYNNDPIQKIEGFWRLVFGSGSPQYFEAQAWADYIPQQIAYYETTPFVGITLPAAACSSSWQ